MKVFIAVDLEGLSGLVSWDSFERPREALTAEANAAVAGAFEGGAREVVVGESHGNMRNLLPDKLDPRARFLSGQPKPMNHMGGLDESFDAAILVGYHAKAGTGRAVLSHTFAGQVYRLRFNEIEVGEIGTDAALAGELGVPVVMVAGDRAACEEAQTLLGDILTVPVKDGAAWTTGLCLPVSEAHTHIRDGARKALARVGQAQPFRIAGPVRGELTFTGPYCADMVSSLPFVERVDGRTVAFEGASFRQAFELFNALHFLAIRE